MKMMLTVTLLVCAMMALTSAARDNPVVEPSTCPSGWTPHNDRCFMYFSTPMTWAQAEKHCQSQGGNLASVHSFREYHEIQMMIKALTNSSPVTWIGGYNVGRKGVWFWSDGTPFEFYYWAAGEPNKSGYCLLMNFGDHKKFDDRACGFKNPFVCAKKP
ncbi:ladderlectin-like [Chaetodon auriga]|uniref:ladderlectin-like n=1 Tax=Chaetodon auriga TaxID=39042 RepID=UPI0040330B18